MSLVVARHPQPSPSLVITAALSSEHFPASKISYLNLMLHSSHACHCTQLPTCETVNIRLNTGAKLAMLCCCFLNHSLAFCAAALSPDKSSLAAEKLKENLRAEGVLEQLVYAAQRHATQEEEPVAAPSQADADDR